MTDYAQPRDYDFCFPSEAENMLHLQQCPGCDLCDALVQFYESCDNCGAWGNMDAMQGVVNEGTATVLCATCMEKYAKDPKSVFILPPA